MAINVGDTVPDFSFQKPEGGDMALRDFAGRPLLVIFLRHLA